MMEQRLEGEKESKVSFNACHRYLTILSYHFHFCLFSYEFLFGILNLESLSVSSCFLTNCELQVLPPGVFDPIKQTDLESKWLLTILLAVIWEQFENSNSILFWVYMLLPVLFTDLLQYGKQKQNSI